MKLHILLYMALLPMLFRAQDKKLGFGIMVSPDYASRATLVATVERPKLGLTAGLCFWYALNGRFSAETGWYYSNKGTQILYNAFANNSGQGGFGHLVAMKSMVNYNYFEIPLKANFRIQGEKLKWMASAGMCASFFLSKNTTMVMVGGGKRTKERQTDLNGITTVLFSPMLGMGILAQLNLASCLRVEPALRFALNNTYKRGSSKLFSFGINVGYVRMF